uniref:Uncharacterized protein n=1 Tax=Megaviridae environmental sample TaxID=1737588 RepID=A0A5J6VJU6_9VIRU|nr:MAG: hypothetical protein [Megaviridae environmental sample]
MESKKFDLEIIKNDILFFKKPFIITGYTLVEVYTKIIDTYKKIDISHDTKEDIIHYKNLSKIMKLYLPYIKRNHKYEIYIKMPFQTSLSQDENIKGNHHILGSCFEFKTSNIKGSIKDHIDTIIKSQDTLLEYINSETGRNKIKDILNSFKDTDHQFKSFLLTLINDTSEDVVEFKNFGSYPFVGYLNENSNMLNFVLNIIPIELGYTNINLTLPDIKKNFFNPILTSDDINLIVDIENYKKNNNYNNLIQKLINKIINNSQVKFKSNILDISYPENSNYNIFYYFSKLSETHTIEQLKELHKNTDKFNTVFKNTLDQIFKILAKIYKNNINRFNNEEIGKEDDFYNRKIVNTHDLRNCIIIIIYYINYQSTSNINHTKLIKMINLITPLLIGQYSTPDYFSVLSNQFTKGSFRLLAKYDNSVLTSNYEYGLPTINISTFREKNIPQWIDDNIFPVYQKKNNTIKLGIGNDFIKDIKHLWYHGFQFRFLDNIPIECLTDIIHIILLLSDKINDTKLNFDTLNDPILNKEISKVLYHGSEYIINEKYIQLLEKNLKVDIDTKYYYLPNELLNIIYSQLVKKCKKSSYKGIYSSSFIQDYNKLNDKINTSCDINSKFINESRILLMSEEDLIIQKKLYKKYMKYKMKFLHLKNQN